MALDSDAGPYGEHPGHVASLRDALWRRPALLLGDIGSGDAFAGIVAQLVHDTLSWQIGASLGLRLRPGNVVDLFCYRSTPEDEAAREHRWCRPMHVITEQMAVLGRASYETQVMAMACSQMKWEIRDRFGAGAAVFEEGRCRSAIPSAADLPDDLCLRVSMVIGTPRLVIAPAPMGQVVAALRFMAGPAEAGYWGCVSVIDERTEERTTVIITDPPRRQASGRA